MSPTNYASPGQAGPGPSSAANAKRRSTVTTIVPNGRGSDSARIGACANCRSRKIKCSGDKPVCKMCAKYDQACEYPIHVSRKKRDKEDREMAADERARAEIKHEHDRKPRTASMDVGQVGMGTMPSYHDISLPVNNFFPTLDFTADSVPIHNPSAFDGTAIDETWLENFLSYDIGAPTPMQLPDTGQFYPNPHANANVDRRPHARPTPAETPAIARNGSTSQSDKKAAKFRVPYFRFFGPTAIAPGYRQVFADVSAPPSPNTRHFALSSLPPSFMDPNGEYPSTEAITHLLPLFQLHFSYFFPLLPPSVGSHASSPPHLINIICALAARYSPIYGAQKRATLGGVEDENTASHTWASKAKEQVSQRLAISDEDLVQTLLMISWYEFGQDRDSGLWMYSGMSLRMGQDLGLDTVCDDTSRSSRPELVPRHRIAGSLLIQDAIMTIGTGRSGMYPTPSSSTSVPHFPPLAASGMTDPFHYMIKIFAIAYRVTQVLVRPDVVDAGELLEKAQSDLNEFNTSLPPELRFETSTFRNYAAIAQGGAFVMIHLWFHTLIILAYQPTIIYSDLPSLDSEDLAHASKEISASSAKTILDIVTFAELIDPKAITQPWVNYPLYTAGRTFLSQTLPTGTPVDSTSEAARTGKIHMAKIARANFQKVVDVLGSLQSYWGGVRYIRSVLVQKGEGAAHLSLVGDDEDVTVPDRVSEWIANASSKQNSDIMGLSFTGTMHSPTDSRFSVVYPSKGASSAYTPA